MIGEKSRLERRTRPEIIRALRQLGGKRQSVPAKKHGNLPL